MLRAWALALALVLSAAQALGRSTGISGGHSSQGARAVLDRLTDSAGGHQRLRQLARQLQQADPRGSGQAAKGPQRQRAAAEPTSGSATGATADAAAGAVLAADAFERRPIWVMIGGERFDATAGGLEYEDGEEAERSAPADGPLKQPQLPAGLVRRHLKIAPYKAADFAGERAAAWQQILDGQ